MYLSKLLNVFGSKINISRKSEVGGFYSDKTMLDKNSVNSNLRNSRNLDFEPGNLLISDDPCCTDLSPKKVGGFKRVKTMLEKISVENLDFEDFYQWIPFGGSFLMSEDNVGQDQRYEQFEEFAESCSQCRRIEPTIVRSNSISNQSTISGLNQ